MPENTPADDGSTEALDGAGGSSAGTQTPEGFVPQADMEREQARARTFQSELDRHKAELAQLRAAAAASAGGEGKSESAQGFDPDAFRASMLRDVLGVTQMATAVADLKGQFPYADDAIYGRIAEFGSPEALRLAVEDSHNRVAALVGKEKESIEAKLREEFGQTIGGGGEGSGSEIPAGDPTVAQLAAMSTAELSELETKSPGVVERVLRSAG